MSTAAVIAQNDTAAPPEKMAKVSSAAVVLAVKKLSEHAQIPTRGSPYAAGYDLYRCAP
jgi:hypothetical protein